MIILLKLLLAHLIGDFVLQPKRGVRQKEKHKLRSWFFYVHVLVHGLLVLLLLWDWTYWPMAIAVMLAHAVIDILKMYAQRPKTKIRWFSIDQSLHILALLGIWFLGTSPHIPWTSIWQNPHVWLYLTAIVFLTSAVGIIIQVLLSKWSAQLIKKEEQDKSLISAGKYIGILERALVFLFIITDHWEAVGFLMAAKSVFRFGDLKESKDRQLTEYMLIGTLLSFGIAIVTALAVLRIAASI